ncbi:hypothetical protein [Streptomyces iconiensis]|uniref:Uncharacterized protein n=1 Tax=Streptomyces iconiensis TaxID=1384038 RepID=A0ABT6ZRX8_9ACTN|nr:hypothetical protein [Streptomyces iconiensis]MDJ1131822.1 hypothetical protein [Streptomyces iconiensis]
MPAPLAPVRKLPAAEHAWLTTEIRDFARHVAGSLVPRGYEAYVRIPHALEGEDPEEGALADALLAAPAPEALRLPPHAPEL